MGEAVRTNKAKENNKRTVNKSAEEGTPETMKPMDVVKVRENIANLVTHSAEVIARAVIEVAKAGQLASAKYLFEVAGVYPATEETVAPEEDEFLARTLMRQMGIPTEPGMRDNAVAAERNNEAKGQEQKKDNVE